MAIAGSLLLVNAEHVSLSNSRAPLRLKINAEPVAGAPFRAQR
jgi:hypothetical protein